MSPALGWLFDTGGFVPRAHCGEAWTPYLAAADRVGNGLIFAAYCAIPVILVLAYRWFRGRREAFTGYPAWTLLAFAAFIFFCGVGHAWEVLVYGWPAYRLFVHWSLGTGVASWVGVYAAWRALLWLQLRYGALADEREAALARERQQREAKHDALNELNEKYLALQVFAAQLEAQANEARRADERERGHNQWAAAKHAVLDDVLARFKSATKVNGNGGG